MKLINGDCLRNKILNESCIKTMGRMSDNSVDIVFTSPPYNRKRNDKYKYYNDTKKDYFDFLVSVIDESLRVCKGNVYFNIMKNYYNKQDVFKIIGKYHKEIYEIFIWEKSNPLPASGKSITNSYEFIMCFGDSLASNKTYTKNHITTSVSKMPKEHKAVMNYRVSEFFIKNFTKECDLVYDPFMGLGTTAKACILNNRDYLGSEIIKEYVDISEQILKESD
tara:strand:+ start:1136 stop:1801 length:666 start_codon:yes stop_codon:yes gene_type:complete